MKKHLVLSSVLVCFNAFAFAQSSKMDKKMETVYKLVNKEKYADADEYLEKVLKDNPGYGKGWDYLANIRYKEYENAKVMDGLFSNMKISTTVKDKDGKEIPANDSLTKQIMGMLTEMSPSKKAYSKYIYTVRQALLSSEDAYHSSTILRNLYVDVSVDTAVGKNALKFYNNAEEEFAKKNYDNAAKLYKQALEEQPDFYKANLYMGDCFFYTANYTAASASFKEASEKFPMLLEPRKYLIDAYARQKLYDKCVEESIAAMTVYPDQSIVIKMEDAAYFLDKKITFKWTPRAVFPNKIADAATASGINVYTPKDTKVKEPWTFYQASMNKIKPYCNSKGIITQANALTQSRYMEVFGWEEMLKNSKDPSLEEARNMQKDGYLDCYVLVTCFHYDFYDQYLDFASKQKAKINDYYKKYIVNK